MFTDDLFAAANAAKSKVSFLRNNPIGYFLAAMLAGAYVGFGTLLIFTIGGLLEGAPYTKIVMGVSFGIALSLVVIAGSELFTGNNMVLAMGTLSKTVTLGDTVKLWITCWIGNWIGSIFLALLFWLAGYATGGVGSFIASTAAAKMSIPFFQLLLRGVLCNALVCLGVWCGIRCKSESGKLIMIFWCLFAFITSGFEHSVANMTLLTISLLSPMGEAVSLSGYLYNIFVVTLGNMIGGIFLIALPYHIIGKRKDVK
ncbi:nitrite transporter NirC [Aequitasia blattaphilus]|uniref:Formate/nitrite transporter family protein n=1 Tax=Aequitasia blattaphilus TaxID=2949332 RepID=A0ABT1ECC1_9FIRM|nr:formate/nitrite transporter family protein [Aequitasia blattaphilus]MCP1103467.1 formate/nitrite transporter family protein [Aequitasia blattaphilus]MCR8616107.1 formate/nitrite transporter family protein [Aequitasia blattaphilus]